VWGGGVRGEGMVGRGGGKGVEGWRERSGEGGGKEWRGWREGCVYGGGGGLEGKNGGRGTSGMQHRYIGRGREYEVSISIVTCY